MPRLLVEPLIFCVAWAALAIAGGYWIGWWVGVLLSLGLLILISASSLQILAQSENAALERQVRWGILAVAAFGLLVWAGA